MQDNFDYKAYLKNNPLLNEIKINDPNNPIASIPNILGEDDIVDKYFDIIDDAVHNLKDREKIKKLADYFKISENAYGEPLDFKKDHVEKLTNAIWDEIFEPIAEDESFGKVIKLGVELYKKGLL